MRYSGQPYWPLLAPLLVRTLQLALPHTFFQPDEFYQALEPAHWLVWGYGHLTWEWRDLPLPPVPSASPASAAWLVALLGPDRLRAWGEVYDAVVVAGRMRGWIWPGIVAGVYKVLQVIGREDLIAIAPRLIGVLVATLTDLGTYRLACKLLGPGAGPTALFLSLTSLFNAHALPRLLSTSPETLLVTWALVYFPLPQPSAPKHVVVGTKQLEASASMKTIRRPAQGQDVKRVESIKDYDYTVMDRMLGNKPTGIFLSTVLATLAICIRPTTLPFWAFLGVDYALRYRSLGGIGSALLAALVTLAFSTYADYTITGRLILPILTFAHHNLLNPVAAFYGATDASYHLVQTIPILTFPFFLPFIRGFLANVLHPAVQPRILRLDRFDRPAGLRIVTRATAFAIFALSLSTHSEWRFLHPFLPVFLVLVISPLTVAYSPTILGAYRFWDCGRQYVRMSKLHFYGALMALLLPYAYLTVHGKAQVEVMNVLRRGELGQVTDVVALMPCHSTPWYSHLHKQADGWFLTCEPPIRVVRSAHVTQQQVFYADPTGYMRDVFPNPPLAPKQGGLAAHPSHVLLFGDVLPLIGHELDDKGYEEVWHGWNGLDFAQDERERRGGVRVWRRISMETANSSG